MSDMPRAGAPPCADGWPRDALNSTHRQELEKASAIDPAVIAERGYRTLLPEHSDELATQGIVLRSTDSFPGLLLPMFRATGERISAQFKSAHPTTIKGKVVKYLSPRGQTNRIDVHLRTVIASGISRSRSGSPKASRSPTASPRKGAAWRR